ncbi:MAG: hypothetical protein PHU14_02170 [Methylovulum sp.]|nr:hypothetical protein [Methylovulum sp.]
MTNKKIVRLGAVQHPTQELPSPIKRPCHYGLESAVMDMETQIGSVEAYNQLCLAARQLKRKIDSGQGKRQAEMYATDPNCIYPVGHKPKQKKPT